VEISEFHYDFPQELIALEPGVESRLLSYERVSSKILHHTFKDLCELLSPTDCLVVNNTKVIPARFFASRETGGGLEGLYIKRTNKGVLVWIKGKVVVGESIQVPGFGPAQVLERKEAQVELLCDGKAFETFLWDKGLTPIPPYIRQQRMRDGIKETKKDDQKDYQSVFAKNFGFYSVAAPTASLHFDEEVLNQLKKKGVEILEVNLQVGEGTFAPVRAKKLADHKMHSEVVSIPAETWKTLKAFKKAGRRVIAVGTTVVRSLESAFLREQEGKNIDQFETELFIKPPFRFSMVDGMITNFHWPDSTLIVLVATFLEAQKGACPPQLTNRWRELYEEAIREKYRLFSYGDAAIII